MADMHLIVHADFDTCQLFAIGPIIGEPVHKDVHGRQSSLGGDGGQRHIRR